MARHIDGAGLCNQLVGKALKDRKARSTDRIGERQLRQADEQSRVQSHVSGYRGAQREQLSRDYRDQSEAEISKTWSGVTGAVGQKPQT